MSARRLLPFLTALCAIVFGFGMFQFIYWNLLWHPPKATG